MAFHQFLIVGNWSPQSKSGGISSVVDFWNIIQKVEEELVESHQLLVIDFSGGDKTSTTLRTNVRQVWWHFISSWLLEIEVLEVSLVAFHQLLIVGNRRSQGKSGGISSVVGYWFFGGDKTSTTLRTNGRQVWWHFISSWLLEIEVLEVSLVAFHQ